MCFSATVSFSAAAGLMITGSLGAYFTLRSNKRFIALNIVTFFYAIQQFSEGMIWLHSPFLSSSFWGRVFLFFAFFVYPWFYGISCYFLTRNKKLKKKILWISFFGFIFGAWAFSNVLWMPNLALAQCRYHIFYDVHLIGGYHLDNPIVGYLLIPIYVFFTSAPFFITDRRYLFIVGWITILTALICWFIYLNYFISVWCFYAAVIAFAIGVVTYLSRATKNY